MATRVISTKMAIEGESEYKSKVASINTELKTLQSQLKLVESEYKGNANSAEALRAKLDVLNKTYDAQDKKVKEMQAGLQNATSARDKHARAAEAARQKEAELVRQLDALKASTGDTSKEQERLAKEIEEVKAQAEYEEAAVRGADKGIQNWTQSLNKTQVELKNTSEEIQKNEKYLSEAEKAADGCAKSIDEMGKETKEAASESEGLGGKFSGALSKIQKGLAAAGIAVTLKAIYSALKECAAASIEFESAMAGVAKTTDMTDGELDVMGEAIKQMATQIPITTTELAGIAEVAGQLGVSKDNLLKFTEVMANLGVATNMTAEEAATMLAQFSAITGMNPSNYERLGSAIVALGNNFATNERKIADFAQTVAGAGVNAGMSETDMLALGAAVTSLGIEAGTGGSNMSKLITAMQTAVETGEDLDVWAKAAGMSAGEFAYLWGTDATGAILAFIQGVNETDMPMAKLLDQLGMGEMRTSRMITSMANAEDASGTLSAALELSGKAWDENSALAEEAATRYETTESRITLLKNSFGNLKTAIGDGFTELIASGADEASDILERLTDKVQHFFTLFDGPGKAKEWFSEAAESVGSLKEAQALLNAVTDEYNSRQEKFSAGMEINVATLFAFKGMIEDAQDIVDSYAASEDNAATAAAAMGESVAITAEEVSKMGEGLETEAAVIDEQFAKLNEIYQGFYDSTHSTIEGITGLYGSLKEATTTSYKEFVKNLDGQLAALSEYNAGTEELIGRNIDGLAELVANYSDGSQQSINAIASLRQMSDEEIRAVIAKLEETKVGTDAAATNAATLKSAYDSEYQQIMNATDEMVAHFNQQSTAYSNAAATASGVVEGLNSRVGEVERLAARYREALASIGSSSRSGSVGRYGHAQGLSYVPYDGYVAELHKGERVLTAAEARAYVDQSMPVFYESSAQNSTVKKIDLGGIHITVNGAGGSRAEANAYGKELAASIKTELRHRGVFDLG